MGTVVISIDAEIGWGHHDLRTPPPERIEYARTGWRRLVDLHDEYRLPATWAVVGHVFLDGCDGVHADHPTPADWFERERNSWADRPDLRFAPDLVDSIVDSSVDHELACHSFSHVLFDAPETTAEVARAELRASRAVLRAHDVPVDRFDSFVFPRNAVDHLDVLAEEGYRCYRGPGSVSRAPRTRSARVEKAARAVVGTPPTPTEPYVDEHGLVNVPGSLYLFAFEGVARSVATAVTGDPIVEWAKHGVDRAARTDGVFHVWLHPNNVAYRWDDARLREIFRYVRAAADDGRVTVEPMRAVARRTAAAA